eukprot:136198-Rhodomonas_salina.4
MVPSAYAFAARSPVQKSGTDMAYGAISLRACYAKSGTDKAYPIPICASYAMSGTDEALHYKLRPFFLVPLGDVWYLLGALRVWLERAHIYLDKEHAPFDIQ